MAHLLRTLFNQDSNVGLYGFANDNVCLLSSTIEKKLAKKVSEILDVPVVQTHMVGTQLVGAFCAGNNKHILVPHILFDSEIKLLEKHKVHFTIIETDHTALGNNVVATDEAALISPELEDLQSAIKKALGVKKIKVATIADLPTIGALMIVTKKGCLLSAIASDEEEKMVGKFFGLPVARGTVNLGSPHVSSGIIANSKGFIFGARTGGPEASHVDEALGFLNR